VELDVFAPQITAFYNRRTHDIIVGVVVVLVTSFLRGQQQQQQTAASSKQQATHSSNSNSKKAAPQLLGHRVVLTFVAGVSQPPRKRISKPLREMGRGFLR